ncbi:MAG: WD40 repeat domain-containing protein, partial [Planctomycetes bacterium]|nr:WD40 repeat domain-containing protein [Planctomycetota bacterium]
AASWDQHLHVFDLQQPDQPLIRRLGAEPEYRAAQCSALSPDGELVAVGCKDDLVHVFRAWSGEHVRDLAGHDKWVEGVAFSPDGARIASGSADLSIRLWDVATGAERARLYGHESVVADLAFLPDGKLLSASHDGTVRVWDAEQAGRRRIDGFAAPAYHGVESPDGKTLAVGFADGSLRLYATATGRETRALREGGGWVNWLVWSADGARLLSAGQDGIEVHRIADGVREHELTEAKGVDAAAWSADGGLVAAVSRDHKVRVWELPAARLRWELDVGKTQYGIAFAPDGARLATVGSAGVFVHDVVDGAIEQRLAGHRGRTRAVQFAPDGALLASAGDDATVRLWRTSDWQPAGVLDAHDNGVRCLSFSPDGRRLATGGADDRLVVWDVASRAATLRLDANDMYCLSWARTGERLWVVPIQRYAFRMDG